MSSLYAVYSVTRKKNRLLLMQAAVSKAGEGPLSLIRLRVVSRPSPIYGKAQLLGGYSLMKLQTLFAEKLHYGEEIFNTSSP